MNSKKIPKGLRDFLPGEARKMRELENRARTVFQSFGYDEVITPTFEYLEVAGKGTGGKSLEELYLMLDREGGILSLRPEMTASIARMAATHFRAEDMPQRLFYLGNVFRHIEPHQAQFREFWQAGIELLGLSGVWADAEIIAIAVKLLRDLGLDHFTISINHIGIINSILDAIDLEPKDKWMLRGLVERKDLVALRRLMQTIPLPDEVKSTLVQLPVLHGGLEILGKLPYLERIRGAGEGMEEMIRLYDTLKLFGVAGNIVLDMGVLRGLDYYTGMVFEGYSPQLGYGLLGGGRYNKLLGQFGFDCPATGFALGLDRLALVLDYRDSSLPRILLGGKDAEKILSRAETLRETGRVVEMDLDQTPPEILQARIARSRKEYQLIYIDEPGI